MTVKMEEKLLTVKEVSAAIGESPNVIRNWLKELREWIPTIRKENMYHYFDQVAIDRLAQIKDLSRNQGFTLKQIAYILTKQDADGETQMIEPSFRGTELSEIKQLLQEQEMFNQKMMTKFDEQQKLIERLLVMERDHQLMQAMKATEYEKAQKSKKGLVRLFLK
ncbi:MAG: MerR family transcriptional regulator [Bacillus sp. (in: firmicutes)]